MLTQDFSLERRIDFQIEDPEGFLKKATEIISLIRSEVDVLHEKGKTLKGTKSEKYIIMLSDLLYDRFGIRFKIIIPRISDPRFKYNAFTIPVLTNYFLIRSENLHKGFTSVLNILNSPRLNNIVSKLSSFITSKLSSDDKDALNEKEIKDNEIKKEKEQYTFINEINKNIRKAFYESFKDKEELVIEFDHKKGKFHTKGFTLYSFLYCDFKGFFEIGLSDREVLSVILHEVGHNFTGYYLVSNLNKINFSLSDHIVDYVKGNYDKTIVELALKSIGGDIPPPSTPRERISLLLGADLLYLSALSEKFLSKHIGQSIPQADVRDENFADSFSVRFGLGKELASGLSKISRAQIPIGVLAGAIFFLFRRYFYRYLPDFIQLYFKIEKIIVKIFIWVILLYYIYRMFSGYSPEDINRLLNLSLLLRQLGYDEQKIKDDIERLNIKDKFFISSILFSILNKAILDPVEYRYDSYRYRIERIKQEIISSIKELIDKFKEEESEEIKEIMKKLIEDTEDINKELNKLSTIAIDVLTRYSVMMLVSRPLFVKLLYLPKTIIDEIKLNRERFTERLINNNLFLSTAKLISELK